MTHESNVDFVLCIGDDKTDEDMFQELKQYDLEHSFSITVEKKPTLASSYLESQADVINLLKSISQIHVQERR
jgi:trehalose 6-phosphate synthase/phosphatase